MSDPDRLLNTLPRGKRELGSIPSSVHDPIDALLDKNNEKLAASIVNNTNVGRLTHACRIIAAWTECFKKINAGSGVVIFSSNLIGEMNSVRTSTVRFVELHQGVQHVLKEIPHIKNKQRRAAEALDFMVKYRKHDFGSSIRGRLNLLSRSLAGSGGGGGREGR